MTIETEDTITETPTGEVAVVPGEGNIPTITPLTERTFPIRDIKLLADARRAFNEHGAAQQSLVQRAVMLYGMLAQAPAAVEEVNKLYKERERLEHRIVAATGGRVKHEDVTGWDFDRAVVILKPEDKPAAPKIVLPE